MYKIKVIKKSLKLPKESLKTKKITTFREKMCYSYKTMQAKR